MKIAIHQPDFIPWLGFYDKIRQSELFIIGDTVQFRKKGWTNRNRIKTANGPFWLSVPVYQELGQSINTVLIRKEKRVETKWFENHLRTLQVNYSKTKYYDDYIGIFEKVYEQDHELLVDCNMNFLKATFQILGINVPIKKLSDLKIDGKKTELVVNICKKVGADTYVSGIGGKNYLDENMLNSNGIKLQYHNYEHPEYQQRFMQLGFISNMSIIDLIFNEGPNSMNILKSGSGISNKI